MGEGYEKLFAKIYRRAVIDDQQTVRSAVQRGLIQQGVDKRRAIDFVTENKDYIKERVQKCVYKESQEWGEGTTRQIQRESIDELVASMIDIYLEENYDKQKKIDHLKQK